VPDPRRRLHGAEREALLDRRADGGAARAERTDGNDELNRPETMSRVGKIGSERVTSVDRAKAVPRPAKAGAATLRPRAATTRRARMRRLTVNRAHARKVCRAGFCRPRHGVRLIQRAARSPSVPDPRQGLGSL